MSSGKRPNCRSETSNGTCRAVRLKQLGGIDVNKSELVGKIAEQTGMTKKDTEKVVNAFVNVVQDTLTEGDTVAILGFGTFLARERPQREGRNPRTGETIQIPASRVPVFRPGRGFKTSVSGDV